MTAHSPSTPPASSSADRSPATRSPGFEEAMAELEQLVAQLENGQLPLDAALDMYQRGVTLLRQCRTTLDAADRRILQLEGEALAPLAADDDR